MDNVQIGNWCVRFQFKLYTHEWKTKATAFKFIIHDDSVFAHRNLIISFCVDSRHTQHHGLNCLQGMRKMFRFMMAKVSLNDVINVLYVILKINSIHCTLNAVRYHSDSMLLNFIKNNFFGNFGKEKKLVTRIFNITINDNSDGWMLRNWNEYVTVCN